jgi:hypothetical protein
MDLSKGSLEVGIEQYFTFLQNGARFYTIKNQKIEGYENCNLFEQ